MSFDAVRIAKTKLKVFFPQFLLLLNLTVLISCEPSTDYCTLRCGKDEHTVCKRKHKCGPVPGCHPVENTVAFRELMVKQHNEYRNKVASGEVGGQYGNKGAKNMNALSYDMEMEYIASCWANVCLKLTHDACRSSKRFWCGQNIYWALNKNETELGVKDWYDEIDFFTKSAWIDKYDPKDYPDDNKRRGHFTALVWATTKYVGCARVRYGKGYSQLYCNYGPGGNMVGASLYEMAGDKSQIASKCDGGKNNIYTSLCGKIDPIPTEPTWAGAHLIVSKKILIHSLTVLLIFFSCIEL